MNLQIFIINIFNKFNKYYIIFISIEKIINSYM